MATIRQGNQGVLIVVDVQVGVVKNAWETPRVVANVARTVERARDQGTPLFGYSTRPTICRTEARSGSGCPSWCLICCPLQTRR